MVRKRAKSVFTRKHTQVSMIKFVYTTICWLVARRLFAQIRLIGKNAFQTDGQTHPLRAALATKNQNEK